MTMIYVDADMVITEPSNDNQVRDLRVWMPGSGQATSSPRR